MKEGRGKEVRDGESKKERYHNFSKSVYLPIYVSFYVKDTHILGN